jgi:hypothetical protein
MPETAWSWTPTGGAMPQGNAGGVEVRTTECPHKGYLKPVRACGSRECAAANERIASMLAFELQLPVPPVLLFWRSGVPTQATAISLIAYDEIYQWGEVWGTTRAMRALAKGALRPTSGMVAFDSWLGNVDRNNAGNGVLGADGDACEFLFIDFAFTMGCSGNVPGGAWDGGKWKSVSVTAIPPVMQEGLSKEALKTTTEQIRNFQAARIEGIVNAVPERFMPGQDRQVTIEGLVGRRQLVADIISTTFSL